MPIVECQVEKCQFHKHKATHSGYVERCAKSIVHINEFGVCIDQKARLERAMQTLERLKKR